MATVSDSRPASSKKGMPDYASPTVTANEIICLKSGLGSRLIHLDICPGFGVILTDIDHFVVELDLDQIRILVRAVSMDYANDLRQRQNRHPIRMILDHAQIYTRYSLMIADSPPAKVGESFDAHSAYVIEDTCSTEHTSSGDTILRCAEALIKFVP
jgi:hypothetical protein